MTYISKNEIIYSYVRKKSKIIGWPQRLDKTESYILSKKTGKHVLRNNILLSNTIIWKGWFTRLERVGEILAKAKENSVAYEKNILWPEINRLYALRPKGAKTVTLHVPSVEMYYTLQPSNQFRFNYPDTTKDLSYSSTYGSKSFDPKRCQTSSTWDTDYFDWENNFQLGENLHKMVRLSNSKFTRLGKARSVFQSILSSKLEVIHEKYLLGDIIEMEIAGTSYRFQKIDRYSRNKDNAYLNWMELSISPIIKVDISKVFPKY